jgi:hypothetical protein
VPGAGGSPSDSLTDVGEFLASVPKHMSRPCRDSADHSVVVDVFAPVLVEALVHKRTNSDRNGSRTYRRQAHRTGCNRKRDRRRTQASGSRRDVRGDGVLRRPAFFHVVFDLETHSDSGGQDVDDRNLLEEVRELGRDLADFRDRFADVTELGVELRA